MVKSFLVRMKIGWNNITEVEDAEDVNGAERINERLDERSKGKRPRLI
ncbi:MAG: hypothetical protein ACTS53_01650 [Candidatus Hodgkinia cicadicola]